MPKFDTRSHRPDTTRDEVVRALLQPDRAQHDELGRTLSVDMNGEDAESHSSPREQAAAPIDLQNVDE